ncbi:hypothetical protein Tco_0953602 [Tanacetum coccineum]|uniref:Uncharacterized protein n=1 Tax=Tanacetum coccineum TaxID=301880 RepID=A0ABQ5E130_9ASTR
MERELRMTRVLTDLCHEVTEEFKDKVNLIEEVKELGGRASASDSMAYLRILREEDMEKAKDIIKLIKETPAHNHGKSVVKAEAAPAVVVVAKMKEIPLEVEKMWKGANIQQLVELAKEAFNGIVHRHRLNRISPMDEAGLSTSQAYGSSSVFISEIGTVGFSDHIVRPTRSG